MTWPVVLIGLGAIGVGYDLQDVDSAGTMTHARAVDCAEDFFLVVGVDPNEEARQRFTAHYAAPSVVAVTQCVDALLGALVIVAAPDGEHLRLVREVLRLSRPLAIWCEKPVGSSSADAEAIVAECDRAGVPLWVNFIRRTDPGFLDAGSRLASALTGESLVRLGYSGDLRHVGCHFVDLLSLWFGELVEVRQAPTGPPPGEPAVCELVMSTARVLLQRIPDGAPKAYVIEVDGPGGSLRYAEPEGVFHWIEPDSDGWTLVASDLAHYQRNALDEVAKALAGATSVLATGSDAVRVHHIIDRIEACA